MGNYCWRYPELNKPGEERVTDNWKTRSFVQCWDRTFFWQISWYIWCAQIPATNFFTVTPVIVGPHCGPCFMSPFWRLEFWDWFPEFLEKFLHPWYMGNTQRWDSAKYYNLAELQRNVIRVCSGPTVIKFPYSFVFFSAWSSIVRLQHTESSFFRQVEADTTMSWLKEGDEEAG